MNPLALILIAGLAVGCAIGFALGTLCGARRRHEADEETIGYLRQDVLWLERDCRNKARDVAAMKRAVEAAGDETRRAVAVARLN